MKKTTTLATLFSVMFWNVGTVAVVELSGEVFLRHAGGNGEKNSVREKVLVFVVRSFASRVSQQWLAIRNCLKLQRRAASREQVGGCLKCRRLE